MSGFELDQRLKADTIPLFEAPAWTALLMDDSRFPWLILVPRQAGLVELSDLAPDALQAVMAESVRLGAALKALTGAEKINIGALGNIVRQLHIHIVARREGDAAWPGPVWGFGARAPYDDAARAALVAKLRAALPA